ncbi:MAG: hypothetical protein J0I11_15015 [Actinobacteria bacterium]|nr:hypothetical protein [Actinomycetota bacterium]
MSRSLRYRAVAAALMGGLIVGSLAACGQAASPASLASDTAVSPAATGDTCPKTAPLMPVNTPLTSGTELLKRSLPASDDGALPTATGGLLCIYDTDWPGPLMRHTKLNVATATKITAMIKDLPPSSPDNRPTSCPGFPSVPPI